MTWIILGLLVWSLVHLMPCLAPGLRSKLIDKLGDAAYRGLFALGILVGLGLMVLGWNIGATGSAYVPPTWGHPVASLLILVGFILFGASHARTNIKRVIRHPMLIGVVVWAFGHLLVNGDTLAVAQFAGLAVWAALEIMLISRREGAWRKPEKAALVDDIKTVVIGVVAYAVVLFAHPYIFGASALPA